MNTVEAFCPSLRKKAEVALAEAIKILERNMARYGEKFPLKFENNVYIPEPIDKDSWLAGFWTGMMWLCYETTSEEKYKEVALKNVDEFKRRIENQIKTNHHDMGFLYSLSCVPAYKITGSEQGKNAAILAAESLVDKFNEKGKYFSSWAYCNNYLMDCIMNLPILYWTTNVTGNPVFAEKAQAHLETVINTIFREDYSTYHLYWFDDEGKPLRGATSQGYSDDSCWSRGQSWAVFGFAWHYGVFKKPEYLSIFKKVTDYFITHLPQDHVSYWDFTFTEGDEPRDSSATAIAVCGILEMAKHLPADDPDMNRYLKAAEKMLDSLIKNYATKYVDNVEGLIVGVTPSKPHGILDACSPYGDYFYLEALVRATRDWEIYW